ncbi:MAG: HEAT repeat domain-containing protein [Myxococcota bacterium]|nr:HEAT repeat domain-containing protein [Myxococcota bacterium]
MSHPLVVRLRSADPGERRAACLAAAEDPAGTLLAEALAERLGDPVKAVVRAASDALVAIGRRAGGVDEAIRVALHSEEPTRRWGAAFTFARLEPPGPRVLPALVEALGSPDGDVRWAAARLLVEAGRIHPEVLPLLLGLVRGGEHALVRRMATFALRELAPDRPEAAEVLLDATDDPDLHVRRAAYTAMASLMGPPPQVAEHLLRTLASDPDAATRRLAALALGEIGASEPDAVPDHTEGALREAGSRSEDPDLRRAIDRALARLGAGQPVP